MDNPKSEETNDQQIDSCLSAGNDEAKDILGTAEKIESCHLKDSLIPNTNLKFNSKIPAKKLGKPFNSEIVAPVTRHFDISRENVLDDRPKTYFDASFDNSLLGQSSEWKMFKETHDNLELFSQNRKLIMEKVLLKNKVERMEKLLENQQNQQTKMADNYFTLLDVLVQFQNQKNSDNSCLEEVLKNRLKMYLQNCPDNLDKSKKEELTNSFLYLSNLSKNVNLNDELSPKKGNRSWKESGSKRFLDDSLKILQLNSQQFSNRSDDKEDLMVAKQNRNSLMSALGNGHIMLTNDLFKSEDQKNRDELENFWNSQSNFQELQHRSEDRGSKSNFSGKESRKELSKPRNDQFEGELNMKFEVTSKAELEIKEVSANKEGSEITYEDGLSGEGDSSEQSSDRTSPFTSKNDPEAPVIESEQSRMVFQDEGEADENNPGRGKRHVIEVESDSSEIQREDKMEWEDSLGVIEYTGEHHPINSIISEPTIEMKNSAMVNAQRLIKQINSTAMLDSLPQGFSSNENVNKQNLIKLVTTREEEGRAKKSRRKNLLYEPEEEEEEEQDLPLLEKIEKIRNDLEQKKIITENIANNTNSSINLAEEIQKVTDSLKNFESFSQKTDGLGNTQNLSELGLQEGLADIFRKRSLAQQDPEDMIDLSKHLQSLPQAKKAEAEVESADELADLPISEKLKLLIQKDLKKEVVVESEFNINLIQSSTGGHPKHNFKNLGDSPGKGKVGEQSQELLKKIKSRTRETRKSLLNFRKSKSPAKGKRSREKVSVSNSIEVFNINENFSKTMSHAKNEQNQGLRDTVDSSKGGAGKPVTRSVTEFRDFSNHKRKGPCRASQTLNDLLRLKKSRTFHRVNQSLQFVDFYEKNQSGSISKLFKKESIKKKGLVKSSNHPVQDFTKKQCLRGSLVSDSFRKLDIKKNKLTSSTNKSLRLIGESQRSIGLKQSLASCNDENKVLKGSNFTKKKIDSGVFDRLARPKSSLIVLKSSKSTSRSMVAEDRLKASDSLSQEDVILSSMKTSHQGKGDIIFDSSLIKLDHLTGKSDLFNEEIVGGLCGQEMTPEEENQPFIPGEQETIEAKQKVFKKKSEIETAVYVLEGAEPKSDSTPDKKKEIETEPEPAAKQQRRRGKKSRKIRRRALTPYNSLKQRYRHLKPRKRERFQITEEEYRRFVKRLTKKQKYKEEKAQSNVKKQYKNFFENDSDGPGAEEKHELNFKKRSLTPDFFGKNPSESEENTFSDFPNRSTPQPINQIPKNIFKETKEEPSIPQNSPKEKELLDYQFSDQYSRYKKNSQDSEMGFDGLSDLTSAVDYTSYSNSVSTGFGRCRDSMASLYELQSNLDNDSLRSKRGQHNSRERNFRLQNQFSSESKMLFKRKQEQAQQEHHSSYKRSYGNRIKNLSSKYKSERGNLLFKNQSQAELKRAPLFEKSPPPSNIYYQHSQHSGFERKFPSPSHKSTQESSYWMKGQQSQNTSANRDKVFSKNIIKREVESSYEPSLASHYQKESQHQGYKFRIPRHPGEKDYQRPIININLGNQPVENLKIVSVPNERGVSKEAMTIQVSYTPSGSQANSKLDNLLSLENSKTSGSKRRYNGRKISGNMVKSILSKRKRKAKPGKEFVISGQGEAKTYGKVLRLNNEGLAGFQDVNMGGQSKNFGRKRSFYKEKHESGKGRQDSPSMVDSNCLDHHHIEQMVQNEDDEILKVMNNKDEIYKITFADSQKSTEMESLLRSTSNLSLNSYSTRPPLQGVNLYNKRFPVVTKSPKPKRNKPNRRSFSPFRKLQDPSLSPNKQGYKYVYEGKGFKKVTIEESPEDDLAGFGGGQWKNRFTRFKMGTVEDMASKNEIEGGSQTFEANISQDEMVEHGDKPSFEDPGYEGEEEGSFENSFDNSD